MRRHIPYEERRRQVLESLARQHRWQPTESERRLWLELRGGKLGVRFVRQVVIGGYIADFASREARVVVEVDGSCHRGRGAADARREERLQRMGWRVVRVDAEAVMRRVRDVVAAVRAAVVP
jgi:very-short-patch-repair endonuclease